MSPEQNIKQAIGQGQFTQAIIMADDALAQLHSSSEQVPILYIKAVALRLSGNIKEAIALNERILSMYEKHARAHQELAYLHKQLGNELASAEAFYHATQINPALLSSWKGLLAHYQQTKNVEAAEIARSQISYLETLPKAIMYARDLMHDGELHKADQLCRQYLQQQKHDPEAMLLLAEIGIALKVYGDAEFLLESCLALHPNHSAAGIEYLKLLTTMGRFQSAKDCADKLLISQPEHPVIIGAKASALLGLGETQEAINLYNALLKSTPKQASLHLLLGHAYKAAGEFTQAITAYQNAYACKADFGDAYWSLANTKTYKFNEAELNSMSQLVESEIALDDKTHLCFALGKALEDKKSYKKSFDYYALGNDLRQQRTQYDPTVFEQQVDNHKRVFTASLFERLAGKGDSSPDPIFIVGLPRAGSTLLEQILASHSKVDGTMELHNILGLAARLKGQSNQYPEMLNELKPDYLARFGKQYIDDTRVYRNNAPFFIDKMPNNFLHIGLIKLILPNAKIIDARREPMACCFSGFKQLFAEGQEFSYGLENIGRYYNAYMDMMSHWNSVLPGFVLHVQHEDVINDLEGQVRRILDFCGLTFEQTCVDFHKTKRIIKTPSSEQVRQPIFKDSMQQHKNFEAQLEPLKRILKTSSH